MAGKRQHFIPQFLQKGFASRVTKRGTYTWVFRRGVLPFTTNIINVGEQGRFYTYDSDTEADDLITIAEREFSDLLHGIREGVTSSLSDPRLPRMIAHLEIRTRHLRANLETLGESAISDILDFVADEETFADKMKDGFQRNSPILRDRLAKGFSEEGVPSNLLDPLVEVAMSLGPNLVDQQKPYFSKFVAELRPLLPNMLMQTAKSAHIEALKQSIAPEAKAEKYANLIYKIIPNMGKEPLILGDSVVLFRVDGVRPYKTYLDANDKLVAVYLPLDSARVLVGAEQHHDTFPTDLREAIARCSLEHFIATANTEANRVLQGAIGTDAPLLPHDEAKAIINQVIQESFPATQPVEEKAMDEKTILDIATIVSRGSVVPATNGLMYVLIALIHKLVEKDLLSEDEVKNMLDLLADTLKRSGEACETETAIIEKTRTLLFSEREPD